MLPEIVIFLLIGIAAGWLAGLVIHKRGFGWVGNLIVGVVGALLGGFLLPLVGLTSHGRVGAFVSAFIGAIVLLVLMQIVQQSQSKGNGKGKARKK